jgi:integrase
MPATNLATLALQFPFAIENRVLGPNGCPREQGPRHNAPRHSRHRLLDAVERQPHRDVYELLGLTGMRIGEVQHLVWDDLDFDNNTIKIQAKPGWKPKSGDARSAPMMGNVKELLARQPRRNEWVFTFHEDGPSPARQIRRGGFWITSNGGSKSSA